MTKACFIRTNLVKKYRPDRLQKKIEMISSRIKKEFPPSEYGYFDTLKNNCDRIKYLIQKEQVRFYILTRQRRSISPVSIKGEYDCAEANTVVGNWLGEQEIEYAMLRGEIGNVMTHAFINIPGYGYFGATPIDNGINKIKIRDIAELSQSSMNECLFSASDMISLNDLRPISWVDLDRKKAMFIMAGIRKYSANSISFQYRASILKELEITNDYFCFLDVKLKNFYAVRYLAEQIGPLGALNYFRNLQDYCKLIEMGDTTNTFIAGWKKKKNEVFYHMITKLDPTVESTR